MDKKSVWKEIQKIKDPMVRAYLENAVQGQTENGTLKKAYELMATAYGKYYAPYSTPEERKELLPQHMEYFMKQAQQLTYGEALESEAQSGNRVDKES